MERSPSGPIMITTSATYQRRFLGSEASNLALVLKGRRDQQRRLSGERVWQDWTAAPLVLTAESSTRRLIRTTSRVVFIQKKGTKVLTLFLARRKGEKGEVLVAARLAAPFLARENLVL